MSLLSPLWVAGMASDVGGIPAQPKVPKDPWGLRLHATQAQTFVAAMEANPSALANFRDVRILLVVTDPDSQIALCLDLMDRCVGLGLRVFAGFMTCAKAANTTLANTWCNIAVWQQNATWLTNIVSQLNGEDWTDKYFSLDMEPYYQAGVPTETSLATNGFTVSDLQEAMSPFLNVIQTICVPASLLPFIYPGDPDHLGQALVTAAAGGRGVVVDETTLPAVDPNSAVESRYRKDPDKGYLEFIGSLQARRSGIMNRHASDVEYAAACTDNILRRWGGHFRTNFADLAPRPGHIFLRTFSDLSSVGATSWFEGTVLNSANDAQFVWTFPPFRVGSIYQGYGQQGDGVQLPLANCNTTDVGGAGDDTSNLPLRYDVGVRLVPPTMLPPPTYTFRAFRASCLPWSPAAADPNLWTVRVRLQLPSGTIGDHPVLSQAQYNFAIWQVWYDTTANALKLKVIHPTGSHPSDDSVFTVLASPPRDQTITLLIGRNGSTQWAYAVNGAAPTRVTAVDHLGNPFTASNNALLVFGGGQTPSAIPATNNQDGMVNMLAVDDLVVWWRNLSDSESQAVQVGTWPWGLT